MPRSGEEYKIAVTPLDDPAIEFPHPENASLFTLKLRKERFDGARRDGGWFDPTYGEDWLEFRIGASSDWKEAMQRWANISYQDSLSHDGLSIS